ncbi:MAG: leucine-rich repeat protein [Barnesiella sp.]|nr:leucine-rich repeat protein [Barnesiella sp.]
MKNTLLRTVVIFVALCIYPSIHAYDFEYDGFYYDITSDSTVSVTHDHGDFYKGDISIPNQATHNGKTYQVTTIDDRAFEGKEQLTSVHISNSIDSIGDYAFCGCPLLTQVSLGEGVT